MTDFLRWLVAAEIVGLAALPLSLWLFRRLPDRGYGFAKILGLVLVTYATWLVGTFVPVAEGVGLPAVALLGVAAGCGWLGRDGALQALAGIRRVIVVEECVFVGALLLWSLVRAHALHPGIGHTEQYMDMAIFGASGRTASYPPFDPWMSGHSINYYYFGYLMFATLGKLAGVSPAIGYNLGLSTLFALTVALAYSVGYALTRSAVWAAVAPIFVGILGNWYAAADAIHHGTLSNNDWFWDATRVVSSGVNGSSDYTINEFPFFSFTLGDLHPHVMGLPVTLLVIALCCSLVFDRERFSLSGREARLWLLIAAICVGSLFTINSWDYPTYLLVISAGIAANGYLTDASPDWWRTPLLCIGTLFGASILLFLPFYLRFKSLAHGFGLVSTPTNLGQFLEVFGLFLLIAAILLGTYNFVLQPADEEELTEDTGAIPTHAAEAGQVRAYDPYYVVLAITVVCVAVLGVRWHLWTLILIASFGGVALTMLHRVLNTEEPNRADAVALILISVGCLVLAITEIIYVKDSFDGSASYRMNTVFKFYYQAWVLLGLAAAYGVFRSWSLLRAYASASYAWIAAGAVAVGGLGGFLYTWSAPGGYEAHFQIGSDVSLDGMSWLQTARPGDYAAIQWLRGHASGNPVVLEATGGEYDSQFARISTFSGLPTVLGWAGHELQWRGADPEIGTRTADINTIYTASNLPETRRLLHSYNVRFVVVGDTERGIKGANLDNFARFMHVAFRSGNTIIYRW